VTHAAATRRHPVVVIDGKCRSQALATAASASPLPANCVR
jgi:hypothetical protein